MMRKSAVVRFFGAQDNYRLGCDLVEWKYCRDCTLETCNRDAHYQFLVGQLYNAYFLEYWQGERTSLHVKGEDGNIDDYIPVEDFEIISDEDNVLNSYEAVVKCITHDYDDALFDLNYGKEYKAIGFDKKGLFLVEDESGDCYFYPRESFEIVSDEYGVLDRSISVPVYDWKHTHKDSIAMISLYAELDNHGILTETMPDDATKYDFKGIREYCKRNNTTLSEMTQEEINQFISK